MIYWGMAELTPKQIEAALPRLKHWTKQGATLRRTYRFRDFAAAIAFVNRVAALAETAAHHPDIDIRWNQVTLTLTSHDAGGLTNKDFDLAQQLDAVAR